MKKLLTATLLILSFGAFATEITLDPTITGQQTLTITCDYPLAREDGTALAISEIAKITFHVKKQGEPDTAYAPAGENTTACQQVYDMTAIPDNVYVYAAKAWDTAGRESIYSLDTVVATVKRLPNPNAPTGMRAAGS